MLFYRFFEKLLISEHIYTSKTIRIAIKSMLVEPVF